MNSSQTLATQSHSFSSFQSPSLHYSLDSSKASNLPKSHHHANSPLQPLQLNNASNQPITPTNGTQKSPNASPMSISHSKSALYASPSAKAIRFPSQNSPSIQKQVTYSPQPPKSVKKMLEERENITHLQEKGSDAGFSTPKKSLFDDSYVHRHIDETDKKVVQSTTDPAMEIENQDPQDPKRNSPLQNQLTPENENLPHSDSRNAVNSEIYEENEDTNNQSTRETVSDKAQDIFLSPKSNTNRPSSLHPNINALVPEIQNENIENREEIFPASSLSNLAPLSLEEGTEGFEIHKNQILAHVSSQADGLQIKPQLSEQSQLSGGFKPKKARQCLNVLCFTDSKDPNLWSKQKVMNSAICKTCFDAYKKNQYCFFCYQIFVDQETSASNDGKDWIECDGCNRWNHIECESIHGLKEIRSLLAGHETTYKYYCPLCRNDKAAKAASKRLKSFMMAPIPVLSKAASGHKSVTVKKSVRVSNKSHGPAHAESTFEEEIETDQIIEEPFGKKIKTNPSANLPLSIIENFLGKIKEKEEIGTTTTAITSVQQALNFLPTPNIPVNTISPLELAKKRLDAMFIKNQANRKRFPLKLEPIPLPMDHYNDIDKLMTIYSGKRVQLSDQEIKADLDLFKELNKTSDDKSNEEESEDGNTPDDSSRRKLSSRPRTKDVQYNENIMGGDYDENKDEGMEYEGKRQLRNRKRPE